MQKLFKKTVLLISLFLCSAIFAAPQIKHLSSLKSYTPKELENVSSLIIGFEEKESN